MMQFTPETSPATIEQAVQSLFDELSPGDRLAAAQATDSAGCHFTVGMAMRNGWGLWQADSPLKQDAVYTYGLAHADDISGLILEWVWAMCKGAEFDPQAHAKRYQHYWRSMGTNALAAGGWPPKQELQQQGAAHGQHAEGTRGVATTKNARHNQ